MQYLKIQNPGVAPTEGFTLLGCSTSVGSDNASVIGQFGSGIKHAINLFLYRGISPVIYCGNTRLRFFTKPREVNDGLKVVTVYQVLVEITGKGTKRTDELSWTLNHGALDWNRLSMAVREVISNGIDRTLKQTGKMDEFCMEVVEENQVRAKKDHTRIFLPYIGEIEDYHKNIRENFLHFASTGTLDQKILALSGRIYRKGVFVCQLPEESLFGYNFGNDLYIDECRNGKISDVRYLISKYLAIHSTHAQKVLLLSKVVSGSKEYEVKFFDFFDDIPENAKLAWQTAFREVVPGPYCIYKDKNLEKFLKNKDVTPVYVEWYWYDFLTKKVKLNGPENVLNKDEQEAFEVFDATAETLKAADDAWDFLLEYIPEGKMFPKVVEFRKNDFKWLGFYREDTLYINQGVKGEQLVQTVLEEMVHHITGFQDNTRELQEFLFMVLMRGMDKRTPIYLLPPK